MKKLAILNLIFNNPPKGGADRDILETCTLLTPDFDLKLFYLKCNGPFPRGSNIADLPFPAIPVETGALTREAILNSFLLALDSFKPDIVYIADGWGLKAYLAAAICRQYPSVLKLYAYEMLCPRNNECWLHDHPCYNNALIDSGKCLSCVRDYARIVRQHKGPAANPLVQEAEIADIWRGDYEELLLTALTHSQVIVSNSQTKQLLQDKLKIEAHIIRGGINLADFSSDTDTSPSSSNHILVPGRMSDPAKGGTTAIQAGEILAEQGINFSMTMTRTPQIDKPWLKETGWLNNKEYIALLSTADIVVVPSLWQEAFGLTCIEAMAAGKCVITTDTAGPRDYIADGENGLLVPPNDAPAIADAIKKLLNDTRLSNHIAKNGRLTAVNHTWDNAANKLRSVLNTLHSNRRVLKQL